jgi:hypothetical protein
MTYFLAAAAASGLFIAAGWRSKRALGLASARDRYALPTDPLWGESESDLSPAQSQTDAGAAVRLALKRLGPVLASQSVQAEVAAPAGLLVRMRGGALTDLLEELIVAVVHSAPASRILLTVATHGDHVEVCVTDDMPGTDPAVRMASVRGLMERVAMRGGALDVDVRSTEGTTMTLRLSRATEQRQKERTLPEPEKATAPPLMQSMGR